MTKKILPAILFFTIFCSLQLPGDVMAGAGTGAQYLFGAVDVSPDAWLKADIDSYTKFSDKLTLFAAGQAYAVYDQALAEFYAMLDLAVDLSWLHDVWLLRWGIGSKGDYALGDALPGLDCTSLLLCSWGSDLLTVKLIPEIAWHSDNRVLLEVPLSLNLSWTLYEQIILAPEISGGLAWIQEGNPEPWYGLACSFDWYPGVPVTLNVLMGWEKHFSDNSYAITDSLTIPMYYAYNDLYADLGVAWLVNDFFNLQFQNLVSYKRMQHNAVLLPDLGTEQEWQFTLKPELKLDFTFTSHFSLLFTLELTEVWSNTPYVEVGYLHAGIEVVITD